MKYVVLLLVFLISPIAFALPKGFVYLHDVDATIIEDMRYASAYNFVGKPIPGYHAARCILTQKTAKQLALLQKEANKKGLMLKVYDCYRPVTAVAAFYRWSQDASDTKMKTAFYPREDKKYLFSKGYISRASGHSRGSTVDLTLVKISEKNRPFKPSLRRCFGKTEGYRNDNSFNTGTSFDCLDESAMAFYLDLTAEQKANRLLLRQLMTSYGFNPYDKEWWHFTLADEPYPQTYFDFAVK